MTDQTKTPLVIAVDFDGTLVQHEYPGIGDPVPYAFETLRRCVERGALVILWTMRSGTNLADAVATCEDHGLKLHGVNENPAQHSWTKSPKAYAHVYVDDAALGCPLVASTGGRSHVDWTAVAPRLFAMIESREHEW